MKRLITAAAALLVVLTGCATVPGSGAPVTLGSAPHGDSGDTLSDVRQLPGKPQPGASPDRIVAGYLAAGKSPDGRHQIARDFLADDPGTSAAAQTWKDTAGTRIITVSTIRVVGTGRVVASGRLVGRLAADGSYRAVGRPLLLSFSLVRVGQGANREWRITNPPLGLLLLQEDFATAYRAVDIYFLSRDGASVVPDHRYVDVERASLATVLVQLLLKGPSQWLAPAVRTAVPADTSLRANVVQDGATSDLTVDLTDQAASNTGARASQLAAQLVWTLRDFGVGLRILVDGRPFEIPDQESVLLPVAYDSYDAQARRIMTRAYFVADGRLRRSSGPNASELTAAPVAGLLAAGLSADRQQLAVVQRTGSGERLMVGPADQRLHTVLRAQGLSVPSWGAGDDQLLIVADRRRLVRIGADRTLQDVAVSGLGSSGSITAARQSPDGTRLAMVIGGELRVGVLVSSRAGLSLRNVRVIDPALSDVRDVSWVESGQLLAAGRLGSGTAGPVLLTDDGSDDTAQSRSGLPAGRPVSGVAAAGNGGELISCGGRIWQRDGAGWSSPLQIGPLPGAAPFYPG